MGYANVFLPAVSAMSQQRQQSPTVTEAPETMTTPQSADPRAMARYVPAMDLDSPANLMRAKAAGINPPQIAEITADLRSTDTKKVVTAMEKLQRFDAR